MSVIVSLIWRGAGAVALLLAWAPLLHAQSIPREVVGRSVTAIEVVVSGVAVQDPHVLSLVDQRVGAPLDLSDVRESVFHLVNLGRYDDVQVQATPRGDGLALAFILLPRRQVSAIRFHGVLGLSEGELLDAVDGRLREDPTVVRMAAAERAVAQLYADRGYLRSTVMATLVDVPGTSDRSEVVFEVDAGPEARIARVEAEIDAPAVFGDVAERLGLVAGRRFDRRLVEGRLARELRTWRDKGYLEAQLSADAMDQGDGSLVAMLTARLGPLVELRFEGDPLPRDVRDAQVPVRQEASVDEDLLEDSQRNLQRHLQAQGYSRASVTYRREGDEQRRFVTFTVSRGPLFRVGEVRISGNSAIPTIELEPLLGIVSGDLFTDAKLDAAESAIRRAYLDRGFPDVRVSSAVDEGPAALPATSGPADGERGVNVRVAVIEGQRFTVASVRFDGRDGLTEGALLTATALVEGEPFVASAVIVAADAIEALYQRSGYRDVQVEPSVERAGTAGGVDVAFRIVEGRRATAGQVIVTGNRRIATDTIRREIAIAPGDALGAEQLVEIQRRVAALGLFRRVQVTEAVQPGSTSRDVVVLVDEAPPTTVGYGGGVEVGTQSVTEADTANERVRFAWRTFFQVGRRNLFGKNRSVNLFTRASLRRKNRELSPSESSLGFNEYRVIGSFQEPRLLDTTANGQISGFLEQTIRASFSFVRRGAQAEVTHPWRRGLTLVGRYTYDNTRLFDESLAPSDRPLIDRLFPRVTLSKFSVGALRDSRDGPLDPSRGSLLGFDQTLALRGLASEVGFSKTFLQAAVYRRVPGTAGVIWAARAQVGLARGFSRTIETADGRPGETTVVRDLPASERFFAGGAITVRGFALDRLGDEATLRDDGFPTGGNGMMVINTEIRLPVWKSLGAALFLDAGNVFQRVSDMSLADLRASPGLGLRYRSPLGPVRVDLGFKLDRRQFRNGAREQLTAFHISIGQAF